MERSIQAYYAALMGDRQGIIAALDGEGMIRWVSPEVQSVLGYEPAALVGLYMLDFVAENEVDVVRSRLRDLLAHPGALMRTRILLRHADGTYRTLSVVSRDLRQTAGIGEVVVHLHDVTGERQLMDELEESRSQLAEAYQIAGLGSWEWNLQDTEVRFSDQLLHLLGWKRQPSTRWNDLRHLFIHPEDLVRVEQAVRAWQVRAPLNLEFRIVWPDGRVRQWLLHAQNFTDAQGHRLRIAGVAMDITERRQAEAELFRAQKLEALDQLAAGIAHDFNNLLTVIQGNLSLAKDSLADHASEPLLAEAEAACNRAAYLAHQLSRYARASSARSFEPTHLRPLLTDVIPFLLRGSRVRSEMKVADDVLPVQGDAGALAQVLQNLVMNAMAAMPDGGVLRTEAENALLPDADPAVPLPEGRYVRLLVADSGRGVAPEHLPRIFDPYFTTRQDGQGLGLATTQRIVLNHQGHIAVSSSTGQGTLFTIYLPAAEIGATGIESGAGTAPSELARGVRALLVDDEALVRSAGARMLKELGCRVEVAGDSGQALGLMRRAMTKGHPFEVVVLDVTMPNDLGAAELLQRLRAIDPMLRAVVSSGYPHHETMRAPRDYGFRTALPKPYGLAELRGALVTALAEVEPPRREP